MLRQQTQNPMASIADVCPILKAAGDHYKVSLSICQHIFPKASKFYQWLVFYMGIVPHMVVVGVNNSEKKTFACTNF